MNESGGLPKGAQLLRVSGTEFAGIRADDFNNEWFEFPTCAGCGQRIYTNDEFVFVKRRNGALNPSEAYCKDCLAKAAQPPKKPPHKHAG